MDAKVVCQEYASSLEDLTFNSKPLINMLTMLAEENSQFASEIVKLIEKRIYEVSIEQKLPALYLIDSIVKNIGKEYIDAVTPCVVALFTHVFEQADEKVRMSMYKLRNTWPQYFPANKLHELDCSVHKRDPGWPVVEPPPASPSVHINPKFLVKVDESSVDESTASSSDEAKILEEFERKKKELEELQGEQMRLQMMQLEELQMKYDLIKKKQEKDRQSLLKQQKEQILKMRLQQEEMDSGEESSSDSKLPALSTEDLQNIRDPRLKRRDQDTDAPPDTGNGDNCHGEVGKTVEKSMPAKPLDVPQSSDKVGFDTEFVPLDKDAENLLPAVSYNRDRPLGKNRYFRKDPNAKLLKSDSDSGSDITDVTKKIKRGEDIRKDSRHGKRLRGGATDHHPLRQDQLSSSSLQTQPKEKQRVINEGISNDRKTAERGRGRGRGSRRPLVDRSEGRLGDHEFVNDFPPGQGTELSNDRPASRYRGRPNPRSDERAESRPSNKDHPSKRPGLRLGDARDDRNDGGKDGRRKRSRRKNDEKEITEKFHENLPGRRNHHEEWNRGRSRRRPRGMHLVGRERGAMERRTRIRHDFPEPVDNAGRLPEMLDQKRTFDRPDGPPQYFEQRFGEEPPLKRSRPSPPKPLFSEREIFEIRERRRESPPREHHDLHPWLDERPGFREPWHPEVSGQIRRPPPEFLERPFPEGQLPRPPRFPASDSRPAFPPRGLPEFPRHVNPVPGNVEIPMELTLDNEPEILKSAEHRLRSGELSQEQYGELREKLQQLYALQKWQRRHSLDLQPPQHDQDHPFMLPPPLRPSAGDLPSNPIALLSENHLGNPGDSERRMFSDGRQDVFVQPSPPARDVTSGGENRPLSPAELMLARRDEPLASFLKHSEHEESMPPSSLVMEKRTVDDLFKRLMDFGIITKINDQASPARTMTPPVTDAPSVQQNPAPEMPEIKLTIDNLRRRYDVVINELYRGTQCSSCGLRFKEADNEKYRQHLDWHFRMNRKEKETLAAHRNWFITRDDWLEFESSEDPKLKARSAVFEAESEDESEKSEEIQEGSCPALVDDTEAERACDICLEKFETFWDETSEDWHYKNAVRVDGKTYHYLCYQDAKEGDHTDDIDATDDYDDDENDADENDADGGDAGVAVNEVDGNDNEADMDYDKAIKGDNMKNPVPNDADGEDGKENQRACASLQNDNEESVAVETSNTDDKSSVDTTVEPNLESVVLGGDHVVTDNTNKEEIKPEFKV